MSDDTTFAGLLFRTAQHRPAPPAASLGHVHTWAAVFVHGYKHDHRHSALRYAAPAQRRAGEEHAILIQRRRLYQQACERRPQR